MAYERTQFTIHSERGIPCSPRWLCDGRLSFGYDEKGIHRLEYFMSVKDNGNPIIFRRGIFDCLRCSVRANGFRYCGDYQNTDVTPFSLCSDWSIGADKGKYGVYAVNEAVVFSFESAFDCDFVLSWYASTQFIPTDNGEVDGGTFGYRRSWHDWSENDGNVQWSIQHQMEAGKYKLRTAPFGYTVRNGELTVNEAEAPIVQDIFNAYLSGANTKEICDRLNAQQGSSRKWLRREIDYILMNERYAGNAIFQKKYTRAELPRTVKRNHGERAMYYVSDSNAPIIPQNVFDRAQEVRKRRTVSRSDEPKVYSGKIQCSCGSRCRAKTSNQIWYWSCVVHEEQRNACHIKQVPEETINVAFCRLYYKLKHHGNPIFTQMLSNLQIIRYSRMLWSEDVISLNKKISDILSQVQFLTQLQQAGGVDPDTFISSNNKLSEQLRRLKQEKARLLDTDSDDMADRTRNLMDVLEDGPDFLDGFDAELFDALVEKIIVDSNERLRFRLKNGLELTEQIERTKR